MGGARGGQELTATGEELEVKNLARVQEAHNPNKKRDWFPDNLEWA